jgi:hypothetical protein
MVVAGYWVLACWLVVVVKPLTAQLHHLYIYDNYNTTSFTFTANEFYSNNASLGFKCFISSSLGFKNALFIIT